MEIELITIGNELLSGYTVNTNATEIAKMLFQAGFRLVRQTVLPDNPETLKVELPKALKRSRIVITTGGLGPTCDDLSRQTVAELFDSGFHYDNQVAEDLKNRFGEKFSTLKDQATVPSDAKIMLNEIGTAPGLVFEREEGTLIMVPGVPYEMRAMVENQVIPYLVQNFSEKISKTIKRLNFIQLVEAEVDPTLRALEVEFPDVSFGIYPGLGLLHVDIVYEGDPSQADAAMKEPYERLVEKFGNSRFESPTGMIEEAVHLAMIEKKLSLSVAESCTGGRLAARLTQLPGASDYFIGSVVSYSNAFKEEVLKVPKALITEHGAVSEQVVKEMVRGILDLTGSDFALAVSGVAGPTGGTVEKPVGTVWCAIGRRGEDPEAWLLKGRGTRQMIIQRSVNVLLAKLLKSVNG